MVSVTFPRGAVFMEKKPVATLAPDADFFDPCFEEREAPPVEAPSDADFFEHRVEDREAPEASLGIGLRPGQPVPGFGLSSLPSKTPLEEAADLDVKKVSKMLLLAADPADPGVPSASSIDDSPRTLSSKDVSSS